MESAFFLDPRTLPLIDDRRVVIVDDVISSGASTIAVLRLLARVGVRPYALIFAMAQGERWKTNLFEFDPMLGNVIFSVLASPLFTANQHGLWQAE